ILSLVMSFLLIRLYHIVGSVIRLDLLVKLALLMVGFFEQIPYGVIICSFTYDTDNVNTSLANDTVQILSSLITVFGSLIMMILISPELVLVFVITVPASIFLTRFLIKRFQPLFSKRSRVLGELNGLSEELTSGQQTIKVYNQEDNTIERFDKMNREAVDAYYNAEYYGSMTGPSVNFINNLSLSLVSVLGAILFLF